MKIYLAASFASQAEMRELARQLNLQGHIVTSTWIFQVEPGLDVDTIRDNPSAAIDHAHADLWGINQSDLVAVFTDKPSTTGGLNVEFGYALGRGKTVVLVGKPQNVFQADVHRFPGITELLQFTERKNHLATT